MLGVSILLEYIRMRASRHLTGMNNPPFSGHTSLSEILPNALLLHSWLPSADSLSWNYTSWSISVEYYVYILFFFTLRLRLNARYIFWMLTVAVVSLGLTTQRLPWVPSAGIAQFFFGSLIYILTKEVKKNLQLSRAALGLVEGLLLFSVIALLSLETRLPRLLYGLVFGSAIMIFSIQGGWFSAFFRWKGFQYLGKISYSIYLVHPSILILNIGFSMVIGRLLHRNSAPYLGGVRYTDYGGWLINNLAVISLLALTVLVSGSTYKAIECRWTRFGTKQIRSHPPGV
jgi:peptidoglycan/LPS O-acetylase OafA/YrhL